MADIGRNTLILLCFGAGCITTLGIVYFIFVRQDSTVLLSLSSIIGGIVGYKIRGLKKS
jgi:xanthosine utilization system XapX-like protein